jgi:hypothetical protein
VDLAVIHEMADLVVTEAAFGALEKEDRHGLPHAFAGSSLVSKRQ